MIQAQTKGSRTGIEKKFTQGGGAPRPVVMVCLSSSPSNKRVIRTAARTAFPIQTGTVPPEPQKSLSPGQSTGISPGQTKTVSPGSKETRGKPAEVLPGKTPPGRAPIALFVGIDGKEPEADSMLSENIQYAREYGFEIHTVIGNDIPLAISEYAKRAEVTDLFLGYSPPPFFLQTRKPINERLLNYLPTVDIHIIPDTVSSPYPGAIRRGSEESPWNLADLLNVLAVMTAATLLSFAFYHSTFSNSNIITIYILAVLVASVTTSSRLYGILAAILYVLLFNFLFIEPRFTLAVYDSTYLVTYLVTMVAALITGTVTIRMKNIARSSAENAYQAKILLDTSNQLETASGSREIVRTTCRQLVHLLNRSVLFLPVDDGDKAPLIFPAGEKTISASVLKSEAEAVRWAEENSSQSGAFTPHFPECTCRYLSIYSGANRFGVIAIDMDGRPFTDFENTILLSIVHECTMALDNERMGQEQKKAEILAENERLRAGLLRSLSHDLRTPLTSISGNASTLRRNEDDLPKSVRYKIYEDIIEDAGWLNAQFENILSMTRLESGRTLQKTVENMEDVIEESLRHISPHPCHKIMFEHTDELLFASMDPKLIMQVLVNLLNNAIKYTPAGSTVRIRAERQKDMVCVEVADDGPGIPDEEKPYVFDLFYTGHHALADSYRSMGLGLNLCAQILQIHEGDIEVFDNPACSTRGTVFRFRLPAAEITLPQ